MFNLPVVIPKCFNQIMRPFSKTGRGKRILENCHTFYGQLSDIKQNRPTQTNPLLLTIFVNTTYFCHKYQEHATSIQNNFFSKTGRRKRILENCHTFLANFLTLNKTYPHKLAPCCSQSLLINLIFVTNFSCHTNTHAYLFNFVI